MTISQMVDAVLVLPEDTKLMILAPVIVNRKGEQLELFVELRAKGFVRVRVDGKVYEIDAAPKLAKNTKHTIEVVVDRLRVRDEFKQRLAESFETALRNGDGRALAVDMDSARSICSRPSSPARSATIRCRNSSRDCSRSTTRWGLPALPWFGLDRFFDPTRIGFPRLSLASVAIRGWDRRNQFYFQMLQSLAKH